MKKLKELLSESYAWEKKPGKPLPTLSEVQAEYERKMAKQRVSESHNDLGVTEPYYVEISVRDAKRALDMITNVRMLKSALDHGIITTYGSNVYATENQTYFRMLMDVLEHASIELSSSSANVDDPEYVWKEEAKPDFLDLDKDGNTEEPMRDASGDMKKLKEIFQEVLEQYGYRSSNTITNTKWDEVVDEYNSKPGFKVETNLVSGTYQAKITETSTGNYWNVVFENNRWIYESKVDGKRNRFKSTDELIDNINDSNSSWDAIDRQRDAEAAAELENAKKFAVTPEGKRAIQTIQKLISKPYTYQQLDKVLRALKLNKQNFKYAADSAGMKFSSSGSGISISDDNYQDPDVSIDYINGKWYVG